VILALPVGGVMGGRGTPSSSDGIPLFATLRAVPEAPAAAPEVSPEIADLPVESRQPAAAEPVPPIDEPAAERSRREPADVVTIPGAYVDARQLTELPRPLEEPPLHLLSSIVARAGVAKLVLYIDQSGSVTSVEVDSTTLPAEATRRAVLVFSGVRFSPGRIGGLAVRSRVSITVGAEKNEAGG
jgi:hypothetical protein